MNPSRSTSAMLATAASPPSAFLPFDLREQSKPLESFGNDNPVEIEIGCGKGKFLLARAQTMPDVNFIGIDMAWKWMKYGVQRCEKRGLENARFIKYDANLVLKYGVPAESVSVFHVYFPDPWPKRRHRKRRIVTGSFLATLHERLVPGGLIELATDHRDYYTHMEEAVIHSGVSWATEKRTTNDRLFAAESATNYEIKYAAAGRTLYYIELRK